MLVFDTEIYGNYFLVSFMDTDTKKIRHFEKYEGHSFDAQTVIKIMKSYTTVGFNSINFDLPVLYGALSDYSNEKLKELVDDIIVNRKPRYMIERDWGMRIPTNWDTIDLIEVAIGKASLKIYGGRMNAPKMQDLPIEPGQILTREEMIKIRDYCENDLHTTAMLYETLKPQIELRKSMSEQYGMDLRSKSDAQIAEAVILGELEKITNKKYSRQEVDDGQSFRFINPNIISFKSKELSEIFSKILKTKFTLGGNGSVVLPEWLKEQKIVINKTEYTMGIGGLHSCEKAQYIKADDKHLLIDMDVASYYPNIILQQNLAPKSMGHYFLKVYQSIVNRRLKAKREGDKVTADTLKICVNGSFGKLGSKYSTLYAPDLLIQTTITGQLALLMLIERIEDAGITVVSANTDGIVMLCPIEKERDLEVVAFNWMLDTSFELERTDYKAIASRDVNSYVAVKTDGKTKGKGVFAPSGLSKNPDFPIIYEAVAKLIANDVPVEYTITKCNDITKFVSVRRVQGGAVWRDEFLGKAVRFYQSSEVNSDECIRYSKNSNKVPKSAGARPLMNLPDSFPSDVNYQFYIQEAEDLLKEVGYV